MDHDYQGGAIDGDVDLHYHVDYYAERDGEYEYGYEIHVGESTFEVIDPDDGGPPLATFDKLADAVRFCFERYAETHVGQKLEPVWGVGAPNGALAEIGFRPEVGIRINDILIEPGESTWKPR